MLLGPSTLTTVVIKEVVFVKKKKLYHWPRWSFFFILNFQNAKKEAEKKRKYFSVEKDKKGRRTGGRILRSRSTRGWGRGREEEGGGAEGRRGGGNEPAFSMIGGQISKWLPAPFSNYTFIECIVLDRIRFFMRLSDDWSGGPLVGWSFYKFCKTFLKKNIKKSVEDTKTKEKKTSLGRDYTTSITTLCKLTCFQVTVKRKC